jgi:hypothetical protein
VVVVVCIVSSFADDHLEPHVVLQAFVGVLKAVHHPVVARVGQQVQHDVGVWWHRLAVAHGDI